MFQTTQGKHARSSYASLGEGIKRNWKNILFYTAITLVYFARAFFLESDLPPWGLVAYQPIDEGTYANLALNLINFGSIDPNDYYAGQYEFFMQPHVICNVVGNAFVALSLFCLGDNYFGLRMGVVVMGYLVLILFCVTIAELRKAYGAKTQSAKVMALLLVVALVTSFVFFNATKAVEPSMARLLLVQLIVYCLVKARISIQLRGLLVGFFTFVSIFFIYVTNLFIGIPVIAYAIFVFATQGKRSGGLFVLFGLVGAALALALAAAYYWYCWGTTPIANAINSVLIFSSSSQSAGAYTIDSNNLLKNIRAFVASNAFFYLLPLAGVVLACFVPLLKQVFRTTGGPLLVLFTTVLGFFAQTMVSDDFVLRKAVVILPTLLLLFYCCFLWLIKSPGKQWSIGRKAIIFIASLLACAAMAYVTYYRLFRANSPTFSRLDYSSFDIVLLLIDCILAVVIVLVFVVAIMANKRNVAAGSLIVSVAVCIVINSCLVLNHNIFNQTYTEKNAMIKLGEVADGKVIAGEYENGFTLYNDILPLLNDYETLTRYLKENSDLLYFDYSNARSSSEDPESLFQQITEVEQFERAYQTFGQQRSVSLYEFDR